MEDEGDLLASLCLFPFSLVDSLRSFPFSLSFVFFFFFFFSCSPRVVVVVVVVVKESDERPFLSIRVSPSAVVAVVDMSAEGVAEGRVSSPPLPLPRLLLPVVVEVVACSSTALDEVDNEDDDEDLRESSLCDVVPCKDIL